MLKREQALFDQAQSLSATEGAKKNRELEARAKKVSELEAALHAQVRTDGRADDGVGGGLREGGRVGGRVERGDRETGLVVGGSGTPR